MERKKLILCLDWSNIAFRSLYISNGYGLRGNFDTEDEIDSFIGKMATDISYLLRMFRPSKILFAVDSKKSWRKDILDTYKANRVKNAKYNWNNIFSALDKFKMHMEKLGFAFIESPRAEADDLMAMVKEIVMEDIGFRNYDLIFITADADIRQLIDFNPESLQYVMVYDEIRKNKWNYIYCNKNTADWIENGKNVKNDIFFTGYQPDISYIQDFLMANKNIRLKETNPQNILLSKIFCGDDGDNVPAFYTWYNKKGKKTRITNSKFTKILDEMNAYDIRTVETRKCELKSALEKTLTRKITDIDVDERLERQEKLVDLNSAIFPESIKKYKNEIKTVIKSEMSFPLDMFSMRKLLKDSGFDKYIKTKGVREFELFKDLSDDLDKYEKKTGKGK